VFRQSVANGDARAVHGGPTGDQIVTADIRPASFHASGGWAGLMARYVDTRTYYYVFLHSSGKASLRRWINGRITVLDEAPFTVTAGTSYRVRMEAIGSSLRLYVNGRLLAEAVDAAIPQGRYGLVTYRAAAEFDNFIATRP
jgi:pectate lyase